MDDGAYKQGDDPQKFQVSTPVLTEAENAFTISEIELLAEVGIGSISNEYPILGITKFQTENPMIRIEYSRNGGKTWTARSSVSVGQIGDYEQRVIARRFGYTKRHGDFMLRFTVTDDVPVTLYSLHADVEVNS